VIGTQRIHGNDDHRSLRGAAHGNTKESECETIRVQINDGAPQQLSIDSL
jgi:hypothetical protein